MTLTELITVKNGVVEQSNFYDYHVPRMKDVPPMHIEVIQTENHPTGAGQMATPLVAPAIASAVAELTGVRLRHTPAGSTEEGAGLASGKMQAGAPSPARPSFAGVDEVINRCPSQLDLYADRTSAATMCANQLRL